MTTAVAIVSIVVGSITFLTVIVTLGWRLRGFQAQNDATGARLDAHERECQTFREMIERSIKSMKERADERHGENVDRLESINDTVGKLDDKIDLLTVRR